jgi:hypothetical protein
VFDSWRLKVKNESNSTPSLAVVKSEGATPAKVEGDITKLSPLALSEAITKTTAAALTVQGRSLVLVRQPKLSLRAGVTPPAVAQKAFDLQADMREHGNFALARLMSGAIQRLTDVDQVTNLMTSALQLMQSEAGASVAEAKEVLAAARINVREMFDNSATFARELGEIDKNLREGEGRFAQALKDLITALDGPSGKIVSLNKSIESVQEELEKNLTGVLEESKAIGDGIKKLVTNVLTTITGYKDDPKPDDDDEGKEKGKGKGKGKDTGDDKPAKFDPFPVEAISTVSDGVAGGASSLSAFRINNKRLAELYQSLASLDALLAAVRAMADQSAAYVRSISALASCADQLQLAWADLLNRIDEVGKQLDTAPMGPATLAETHRLWGRLRQRINELQQAVVGRTTAFPQVPSIS